MHRLAVAVLLLAGAVQLAGCSCDGSVISLSRDGGSVAPSGGGADDAGATDTDAGATDTDAGVGDGGIDCSASCNPPEVCRFGACVPPPVACSSNGQCSNDTVCRNNECLRFTEAIPAGFDPACRRLAVLGLFSPKLQCEWIGPASGDPYPDHVNVLSTPLVVDFNFDGNPETLEPSIVFNTYNCDDGACGAQPGCYGVVRVIDGATCQAQYTVGGPGATDIIGDVTPALGDLDGDGRADIVVARSGGGVMAYRFNPAADGFEPLWANFSSFNAAGCHWDSVAIHDLDDDGVPEILQNGPFPAAYDNHGALIAGSVVSSQYSHMLHPVLADVDGDGQVEMLDGKQLQRFNKSTRTWEQLLESANPLGHVAIADFGTFGASAGPDARSTLDGVAELAVVSNGSVRIQTLSGRVVFGPVVLPGGGSGGPPTAGDFDGDGRVEIGVAGATGYSVFDPDCTAVGTPAHCPSGATTGVLWSRASQDQTSNVTGSSVFDFDGDGSAEVVYADECYSRVYEGKTGVVLFSQQHTSCTWYENPIVADVDGDFRSEVVIPSNVNCAPVCPELDPVHEGVRCDSGADCPGTTACVRELDSDRFGLCRCTARADCGSPGLECAPPASGSSAKGNVCRAFHPSGQLEHGIKVLRDVLDRWVGSRPIWNQHAYAVTHINDDGTVPRTSQWKQNWKDPKLNNFRMNVQGSLNPENVPDLTSAADASATTELDCTNGTVELKARICNRGTGPVGPGEPLSFYAVSRSPANRICTASTSAALGPGQCEVVGCSWPHAPNQPTDVVVWADDDGTGAGTSSECEEQNNAGTLAGVVCTELR